MIESFSPVDLSISEYAISEIAGNVVSKNSTWFWWVLVFLFIATVIFLLVEGNKIKSNPDPYKTGSKFF
ncbi:MAG: hypothetical protein IPH42_03610 [Bacteroidetes bacterium]|nr:hypothetical protein [Bacteroidota bacterium]